MNGNSRFPPGFFRTIRLLLATARRRSEGRRKRQQELLNHRTKKSATDWSALAYGFVVLLMAGVNVCAAFVLYNAVASAQRLKAEQQGRIVVSRSFLDALHSARNYPTSEQAWPGDPGSAAYSSEAKEIADEYGGTESAIEQRLRDSLRDHGPDAFLSKEEAAPGLAGIATDDRLSPMLVSIVLLWWTAMLVFHGEGLEMDTQRRRDPMWEWLFTHPVPAGAIFMAEMLAPVAASPIYWSGPLFVGIAFGFIYGPLLGLLAIIIIGIPVSLATACMGKALEIGVTLRFPPRSRGAIIGLMSWIGYASLMLFFFAIYAIPKAVTLLTVPLSALARFPWPRLDVFLGIEADGSVSFLLGMVLCWIAAAAITAGAVLFSVWGTQKGLSGSFAADTRPSSSRGRQSRFGKEPLYRKEFLWFIRDRSAIVQTVLIPLTLACFQVFNMRFLLSHAQGAWNYLCGAAILFGTYFLWILGPKSLASEGSALWIALTWPRGLESLLKAKAWLWSLISSGIVALILCYASFLFPREIWKIALVGVGWFIFARSMAEKSVTLVTVTSSSGEPEKIPWSRRGAAQLGMLTFSIGVLTQQWHVAIMGIVYSYITAAAIWQNFRARLPFLYDPWSERLPPPPTLMHAMVSISLLIEGGAVLTAFIVGVGGADIIAVAQAIGYAICAVMMSIGVTDFLEKRGVTPRQVWSWPTTASTVDASEPWWRGFGSRDGKFLPYLLVAACGGVLLGVFAHGYLALLSHLPATAEIMRKSNEAMARIPFLRVSYAVMAVFFAPFAEEYLFRGLLFRALDREWGGWRAVVGSAAFFAIYHPPLAWIPVGLLGIANALLFKKSGRLMPAVILHMVYNALVLP